MDHIYCYPNSNVLINKLNIHDVTRLSEAERKLTGLRIYDLIEKPMKGRFDFNHLKKIHEYIFQDIYAWAGKVRTVEIAKGNMFCKAQFIEAQAEMLFANLKAENFLRELDTDDIIARLAYYLGEINALHPFREGNGRTQREFIRELALSAGYIIRFAHVSEEEMLEASKASFLCDYSKMENLIRKCIQK